MFVYEATNPIITMASVQTFGLQVTRFNLLILPLLTFLNVGATILATLTQRGAVPCDTRASLTPSLGADQVCRYAPSHLLATAEVIKLLVSLLWCAADVYAQCTAPAAGVESEYAQLADSTKSNLGESRRTRSASMSSSEAEVPSATPGVGLVCVADSSSPETTERAVCKARSKQTSADTGLSAAALATENGRGNAVDASSLLTPREELSAIPRLAEVPATVAPASSNARPCRAAFWRSYLRTLRVELGLSSGNIVETFTMVIPAVLYAVQNTLVLKTLQLTNPAVFQLCYLIRILFLAVLMRVVLQLCLTMRQSVALVVLTAGIGLAQWKPSDSRAKVAPVGATAGSPAIVLMIMCAALISSGTGVFLEVVFKKRSSHFHLSARNVHLAFFSILVFSGKLAFDYRSLAAQLTEHAHLGARPQEIFISTFHRGFTPLVWCLVLMQSGSGILLAFVMKYSNNIMKTFSTSLSLIISMIVSVFLFDMAVPLHFLAGVAMVLLSIYLYNVK